MQAGHTLIRPRRTPRQLKHLGIMSESAESWMSDSAMPVFSSLMTLIASLIKTLVVLSLQLTAFSCGVWPFIFLILCELRGLYLTYVRDGGSDPDSLSQDDTQTPAAEEKPVPMTDHHKTAATASAVTEAATTESTSGLAPVSNSVPEANVPASSSSSSSTPTVSQATPGLSNTALDVTAPTRTERGVTEPANHETTGAVAPVVSPASEPSTSSESNAAEPLAQRLAPQTQQVSLSDTTSLLSDTPEPAPSSTTSSHLLHDTDYVPPGDSIPKPIPAIRDASPVTRARISVVSTGSGHGLNPTTSMNPGSNALLRPESNQRESADANASSSASTVVSTPSRSPTSTQAGQSSPMPPIVMNYPHDPM